ncbi:MAG: tadB [Burkholderiaceae bacterium]|nr:tadB [Burkholderiaceae bacterium]
MDYLYIFFAIAVFIAVVLLVEGLFTTWNTTYGPEAKHISQRLRIMSAGAHASESTEVSIVKQRLLSKIPKIQSLLMSLPRIHPLDRLLQQSGSKLDLSQFIATIIASAVTAMIILWLLRMPFWLAIWLTIAAACVPVLLLLNKKYKRLSKIEELLPDALDLMARAMRAGHAFPSSLQMVGNEMPEPIAGEFRIVFDEVNYGISMQDSLKNLATRVPSTDLNYFVVAVLIQRETGGNLAELLASIATIIRERFKLFGQIKVLTAEGRLSAWILCLLPFAMAFILHLINPAYMSLLWTERSGLIMMGVALILMLVGVVWMRQLIRIRV